MIARHKAILYLLSALLVGGLGGVLLGDRPGLQVEYYPLTPSWEGSPVYVGTGEPQVGGAEELHALVSKEIFSVRWRGWLVTEASGEHGFQVMADEGGYLKLDGERLAPRDSRVTLESGVHSIEIGFYQTGRESRLQTLWTPPHGEVAPLPIQRLHARHPVRLRSLLRRALAPVAVPYRRLLGALLVLAGFLSVRDGLRSSGLQLGTLGGAGRCHRLGPRARRTVYGGLLVGLFVMCWLWTTRFTAPLLGGDDVLYVYKALFPAKSNWFYNRYVHVYLVKAFVWLRDGGGFLGSRTYWSFLFAVTVSALAVGCRSLGPRLQLRTLAVTLFLLVSQTSLMGRAGGAYADYTSMMFVTVAVAVYLHGLSGEQRRGRHAWHELAIGALTVAACKSKETGIILAWLPLLFLWSGGRLDLRRFARKMGYWAAGVIAAWLVLMSLDAWLLGDFWYSLQPDFAAMKRLHVSQPMRLQRSISRWTHVVLSPDSSAAHHALRYLWILVLAAPLVAAVRRKRAELRLFHLMPLVYLLLLIAVHTRAPHIFSTRYLFPILPVCCLSAGALFNYLGLEEQPWRQLLQPRVLVPLFAGAAVLLLLLNPARVETVGPARGAGAAVIWAGWLLLVVATVPLVRRHGRTALIVILLLVLFGPSFERVRQSLAPRLLAQRGELILYPWRAFQEEIESARPSTLVAAPELWRSYRMVGKRSTRELIARIYFRREEVEMWQSREAGSDMDFAIAGPEGLRLWRRQIPGLEATAVYDPSGLLALVRPGEALGATTE